MYIYLIIKFLRVYTTFSLLSKDGISIILIIIFIFNLGLIMYKTVIHCSICV